jgi:hypothetical protein
MLTETRLPNPTVALAVLQLKDSCVIARDNLQAIYREADRRDQHPWMVLGHYTS